MPTSECKGSEDSRRESKLSDERSEAKGAGDAGGGEHSARLELVSVDCGPSDCPVGERLELSMDFTVDRPLQSSSWDVKFLVDSVHRRHVVRLGTTEPTDYPRGLCSMRFKVSEISVEGIEPCTLANTGLLVAALRSPSQARDSSKEEGAWEEIAAVNLVVQVEDDGQGRLRRCIYSPLE